MIQRLSGYLLASSNVIFERDTILLSKNMSFVGKYCKSDWEEFTFESKIPLIELEDITSEGPYYYPVICRRSGPKILFLSSSKAVVDYILEKEFSRIFRPHLIKVQIDIDNLIRTLSLKPAKYVFSFAHARVSAYGNSLKAVSFYGEDLSEASLFRSNLELMNFFTCGLRKAIGGTEIIRLGTDGSVAFNVIKQDNLADVKEVLKYLRDNNYLNIDL